MSKAKILIPVLVIACALALLFIPQDKEGGRKEPATAARIVLYGYTTDGRISWEIAAEEGRIERDEEDLSDVTIRFPQEDGEDLLISAASLIQRGRIRTLSGEVRIKRGDTFEMSTDSLDWNDETSTLSADRINLVYGKIEVVGGGFLYDLKSQLVSLSNGLEGKIAREEPIFISAECAEEENGRIVIAGNVALESGKKSYRCDRLESDREGKIITLSGSVAAYLPEGELTGERLVIGPDGISVSGSVRLDLKLKGENGA